METTLFDPKGLFQAANLLALPGWLWLMVWLFLPRTAQNATRYGGLILPLVLAILYASSMLVHFSSATGGFDSLAGVLSLFRHPGATLAGWVHFLAFDLFAGWCITRHSVTSKVNRLLVILCLLLTFMFGPIGLLVYCLLLVTTLLIHPRQKRSEPGDSLWRQVFAGQSSLVKCALFLAGLLPVLLLAYVMETRIILEANVWLKPLKFTIALIVYTLTLSWYANYLPQSWRDAPFFKRFSMLTVAAVALEMIWLIYAAAIGEPSHFNQTHAFLRVVYFFMGLTAIVLTAQSLITGLGILRFKDSSLHPLTRYSLAYGLIATFVLTLITAGYMSGAPAQSHAVLADGVNSISERDSLPFLGWLYEAGDLRVSHFFATHALHAVPLIGWTLSVVTGNKTSGDWLRYRKHALILTILYCLFVAFVFFQAMAGEPFL